MPTCTIDGREVDFKPGENLVEVAKRVGIDIPIFCYHPGLSVVAQCRMCAVEIEGQKKLATACSTAAADKMVVKTQTPTAKKHREAVMEFLLLNHPLDCPICDKAGECELQNHSFDHGSPHMRTTENRRTYVDLDMGPVIRKNMNRCIHCTRCIRFGDEIAGMREMVALQRGARTEISTIEGQALQTPYAGNYADICPTGSLTLKDFRFKKRAWYLKKTGTVCEGCSRGCAIELQHENGIIYRTVGRENPEINKYWICDEGRFNFHYTHDPDRIVEPSMRDGAGLVLSDWTTTARRLGALLTKDVTVLVGTDLTQEELVAVLDFSAQALGGALVQHFGTPGVEHASKDGDEDRILRRLSKTANLHGAEKLGIKPFLSATTKTHLVFRGGRARLPVLPGRVIGVGVFKKEDCSHFDGVLPGLNFVEKNGTIVSCSGVEQCFVQAVRPAGNSRSIVEILKLLREGVA